MLAFVASRPALKGTFVNSDCLAAWCFVPAAVALGSGHTGDLQSDQLPAGGDRRYAPYWMGRRHICSSGLVVAYGLLGARPGSPFPGKAVAPHDRTPLFLSSSADRAPTFVRVLPTDGAAPRAPALPRHRGEPFIISLPLRYHWTQLLGEEQWWPRVQVGEAASSGQVEAVQLSNMGAET